MTETKLGNKPIEATLTNSWFGKISSLLDKGFEIKSNTELNGTNMYYEFSDYELLEFVAYEKDAPVGKILVIDELKLWNPMTDEVYVTINYDLMYKNVDEFLVLLKALGYEIK